MSVARAIIVDDEPLARLGLRDLLADDPRIEVIAECANAREAMAAAAAHHPEVVFLDIRMPGMDGLDLAMALRAASIARTPSIIFVTAFDGHAIDAFDTDATDYILKPIDPARLAIAIDRALDRIAPQPGDGSRLAVTSGNRRLLLRPDEIDWIEARSYYARLHVGSRHFLVRESMHALERRLGSKRFARIHRSTIVNVDRVTEVQPHGRRSFVVVLRDGRRLVMSRNRRHSLGTLFD